MCDPFRVVMWFVGGGRFPGPLPPATLPAPFQGASSSTSSSTSRTSEGRCSIYYAPGTTESNKFAPPNAHARSPELNLDVRTRNYSLEPVPTRTAGPGTGSALAAACGRSRRGMGTGLALDLPCLSPAAGRRRLLASCLRIHCSQGVGWCERKRCRRQHCSSQPPAAGLRTAPLPA